MNIEERLREVARFYYGVSSSKKPDISLTDALEICKDLFTKEQVEELLKKQREICADIACVSMPTHLHLHGTKNVNSIQIANAPSPLEGEKK